MKIAILGGGIAGLTLARALDHVGLHDYHVYEQAPEFAEVGAAISVFPNALRVLRHLGMLDLLRPKWGEIQEARILTSRGRTLSRYRPAYDLPAVCMHRADLQACLLEGVDSSRRSGGHRAVKFEETPEGVTVHFDGGHPATADLVVGADGINSAIRMQLLNDGPPIYRGCNVWRGVTKLDDSTGLGSETWGCGQRAGIVRIRNDEVGWWVTVNEPINTSDEPEGRREKLLRLFGDWHDPLPTLIRQSGPILKNALVDRPPRRGWSRGRVVLLGDAAHPTTPNLGQGGAMAIEGAYLLAQCMKKYLPDFSRAFARYEELHAPRTTRVNLESLKLGRIGQMENRLAIPLRNFAVWATPSSITRKMLDEYFSFDATAVNV